jgi:hypothetical protein
VTDGLALRILIAVLSATQAGIAALLAFSDLALPVEAKASCVVASAVIGVLLNQVPSWQQAPAAQRALQKAGTE